MALSLAELSAVAAEAEGRVSTVCTAPIALGQAVFAGAVAATHPDFES